MEGHEATFAEQIEAQRHSCACASAPRFRLGSTERKYERSRGFAVSHLCLDLDVDLKTKSVSGTARLDFERRAPSAEALRIDGCGLSIRSIELVTQTRRAGSEKSRILSAKEYSYDGDELVVPLTKSVASGSILISYSATPRLGLYFLEPDEQVPDRPVQVWSQCQDEDGKYWFFCQDKPHVKMTYELIARVPKGMTVLCGGKLISKKNRGSRKSEFHFRLDEPTPAYLVTLVVGKFDEWQEQLTLPSGRTIDLRYLVPQGKLEDAKRAFARTADAIELFSRFTHTEYPYDSYSQVVVADFIFGGMENTTATTMYEHILVDETAALDIDSHDLVAHELAHQWFGDLVTCRDWSHGWLNEGFATYFEHIELEDRLGLDEYEHNVTVDLNQYLNEARSNYRRAIVCRDYDEPIELFDRHLYQKGGLVLHMLRKRLGDDCFRLGIKNYLAAHRGGIVETSNLVRSLEETSGLSLERFFDEWVYRPGHPSLKIKLSFEGDHLHVDVEQTQKGDDVATFELPFSVQVAVAGKTSVHSRLMTDKISTLVIPCKARPDWFAIDPDYLICAPITLQAPADLLRGALSSAPRARSRRMAALALAKRQDPDTVDALAQSLANTSEQWMVRAKAAEGLGNIQGQSALLALRRATKTKHPKVRRAVAEALGRLRGDDARSALHALTSDSSYLVTAAAARALGNIQPSKDGEILTDLLNKDSWSDVVRAGALTALSKSDLEEVIPLLTEWSQYGRPPRARRAAITALGEVGEGRKVRLHLQEILFDHDPHIRSCAVAALGSLNDPRAKASLGVLLERELNGAVRTQAAQVLSSLGKAGSLGLKELRKENQKLEKELVEVKTRLSKLEQQQKASRSQKTSRRTAGRSRN